MAHEDRLYLSHVLDAADRIEVYIAGLDLVAFLDDPLRQDGVIRQLGVIGEAVKHLSQEVRDSASAFLRISFARFSSRFSRSRSLIRCRSSVVGP